MAYASWYERLRDVRWQRRRLEMLSLRNWTCEQCLTTTKELTVHHACYLRGRAPWDYTDNQLWVLCWPCHKDAQEVHGRISAAIAEFGPLHLQHVERLIRSIHPNKTWCKTHQGRRQLPPRELPPMIQRRLWGDS